MILINCRMQSLEGELNQVQFSQVDQLQKIQDSDRIVTDKRRELQVYKGQVPEIRNPNQRLFLVKKNKLCLPALDIK